MEPSDRHNYQPSDTLHLWWLAQPASPVLIGTLRTVRAQKGVSLRYHADWLHCPKGMPSPFSALTAKTKIACTPCQPMWRCARQAR